MERVLWRGGDVETYAHISQLECSTQPSGIGCAVVRSANSRATPATFYSGMQEEPPKGSTATVNLPSPVHYYQRTLPSSFLPCVDLQHNRNSKTALVCSASSSGLILRVQLGPLGRRLILPHRFLSARLPCWLGFRRLRLPVVRNAGLLLSSGLLRSCLGGRLLLRRLGLRRVLRGPSAAGTAAALLQLDLRTLQHPLAGDLGSAVGQRQVVPVDAATDLVVNGHQEGDL